MTTQNIDNKILLVEDEKKLAKLIKDYLQGKGFIVTAEYKGKDALRTLNGEKFSAIILDRRLPDINGLEICKTVREKGLLTPIIFLTVMSTTEQRVTGLDAGADDYLCKPFDLPELLARIRSLIRRSTADPLKPLTLDNLTLHPIQRKVFRAGREVFLSKLEFNLLEYLMRNQDRSISREALLEHIWGIKHDPRSNIVEVYINYLRKKIDIPPNTTLIHTVRKQGYLLGLKP